MKRPLALLLMMLATAASATVVRPTAHELATDVAAADVPSRAPAGRKTQWAPSGDFSALHARVVFEEKTRGSTSLYAGEAAESAVAERDWTYANGNPLRYVDPDGRRPCKQSELNGNEVALTTDPQLAEQLFQATNDELCEAWDPAQGARLPLGAPGGVAILMEEPGAAMALPNLVLVGGETVAPAYSWHLITPETQSVGPGGELTTTPAQVENRGVVYGPTSPLEAAKLGLDALTVIGLGAQFKAEQLAIKELAAQRQLAKSGGNWVWGRDVRLLSPPPEPSAPLQLPSGPVARLRQAVLDRAAKIIAEQSSRQRGPVLTGVMDTRTGKVFFGQNVGVPEVLDPILEQRLSALLAETGGGGLFPRPGPTNLPGAHSEINALNDALQARRASGIPVSEENLGEFLLHNVVLRGARKGVENVVRCANCSPLTRGVRSISD